MFCGQCGTKNEKGAAFCENCGAKLKEVSKEESKEKEATVKKVEKATGRKYNWQNLKKYCESAGLCWNKAFDSNYGSVNSYPAEAWKNVYGVEIKCE